MEIIFIISIVSFLITISYQTKTMGQISKENHIDNVTCETEDFFTFKPVQKYDTVIITGSLDEVPSMVFDWLNNDGKVFAVIGKEPIMEARVYDSPGSYSSHFDTVVAKLVQADQQQTFKL